MKKPTFKSVPLETVRPIDASLHQVLGGSMGSQMLAGAAAGAAAGATAIQLKPFPVDEPIELKPFPR